MAFNDKVVLITGGGSGLGAAVAQAVVDGGGKVALLDVNDTGGQAMADALGDAAIFCRCDVTSESDGQAAIDAARAAFGRIDGLVNCAGVAPGEKIVGRDGPHAPRQARHLPLHGWRSVTGRHVRPEAAPGARSRQAHRHRTSADAVR